MNELIASLPTPLAVPLASFDFNIKKDPRQFFTLVELSLTYVEYVLRAQSKDREGLDRPVAMGQRIRRIRMLYERLSLQGRVPMIESWNNPDYYEKLASMVQARNRWAHARHDDAGRNHAENLSDSYEAFLHALSPLTNTHLLVMKLDFSGQPECYLLQGTKGLFEPQRYRSVELPGNLEQFSLVAHNNSRTVSLKPFLRYREGSYGESRVEFLSTIHNDNANYVDPLPRTDANAGVDRSGGKAQPPRLASRPSTK